jgi:Fe-S cluster assembly scaffold protein SufB
MLSVPHEAISVHRRIALGAGSRLAATEEVYSAHHPAGHQRWFSSQVDLDLGLHAQALFLTVHAADPDAVGYFGRHAELGERSRLNWTWTGFGGFRTRVRNATTLRGTGADVEDLQTFFGDGEQSFDSAVDLTHVGTDTHGQSITRGVFRDRARGMSRGLVRIEKDARRTVSYLSEHAMLLSRGARSDTIPILEILCRDVKATHSTSVAPVDPEKVFYLESRGFPETDAVRMIGEGFLSYVLSRSPVEGLRELLYPLLSQRWEGVRSPFRTPGLGQLPDLNVSSTPGVTDWRFDSKLR